MDGVINHNNNCDAAVTNFFKNCFPIPLIPLVTPSNRHKAPLPNHSTIFAQP
jgi:hypothetical protein